jgi:hypothetical protein
MVSGRLGGGMVPGARLQPLGGVQLLLERGELVGVEQAVAPGVAEHDGGAARVDPVEVGRGGALLAPGDHVGLLVVTGGEEVGEGLLEAAAGAAGEVSTFPLSVTPPEPGMSTKRTAGAANAAVGAAPSAAVAARTVVVGRPEVTGG